MPATILIVDDSAMMRGMVRSALEAGQHRVVEACDGQEALVVIDGANPDLMITDVNMPRMDGLSLIKALREQPRYLYMPILVLTTEASDVMIRRGREAGATGWLVKPFHPEQLRQTTLQALELRQKALRKQESGVRSQESVRNVRNEKLPITTPLTTHNPTPDSS